LDQPGLKLFTCAQGLRRVPISIPDFSVRDPLGLCLAQARTDDVVAILNRRKYPLLIRQKEQDVNSHYLHGPQTPFFTLPPEIIKKIMLWIATSDLIDFYRDTERPDSHSFLPIMLTSK
jgi:hypothetical protein